MTTEPVPTEATPPQGDPAPAQAPAPAPAPAPTPEPKPDATEKPATDALSYDGLKLPEGYTEDAEIMGEFRDLAKSKGLSREDAQKHVDLAGKMLAKQAARQSEQLTAMVEDWKTASKTDKEIGGDAFDANVAKAQTAIKAYASPAFLELLDKTQLGNHPEFLRFCLRAAKNLAEDTIVGGPKPTPPKSLAERMFT